MRIPHRVASVLLLPLLGACASSLQQTTTYKYPPLGAGPVFIEGVVLDRGKEVDAVSAAIVGALQAMGFTISKPPLNLQNLPQHTQWITDTVQLSPQFVARYGAVRPPPLPPGRIYGLTFVGRYRVGDGQIRFSIEPELLERGAMSPYQRFKGSYTRFFFVDSLKAVIDSALLRDSERRQRGT